MTAHETVPPAQEGVVSLRPFVVRRAARWSDCDPAGVVYAGHFPLYMLDACHLFGEHVLKPALPPGISHRAPGKGLELEFLSSLWPGDQFDMEVHPAGTGAHTVHLLIAARRVDDARPVFLGRMTSIHVSADDRTIAVPVPPEIRAALDAYAARSGPIPGILHKLSPATRFAKG
ncbi:acyl-CoA thioesterase (plasmid) [Tistrella mobilis]|jgi:acyl-CoA thioesterase FadM|uniref:acyl-CoA thioesterase n=1 Tax=Tistrella mobilis TaxID=171437 RepID=UPI0035560DA8